MGTLLALQTLFGAQGIAAHSNLLLDWLLTMPWYIGMVILFVRAQASFRFPAAIVLLLGGLYELGADGFVGGVIIPTLMGETRNWIEYVGFIVLIVFWEFVLVYSSMVLPSAWVIEAAPPVAPTTSVWRAALSPLMWLIPFTLYVVVLLLLLAMLGVAE
jgi:hypothetical protein